MVLAFCLSDEKHLMNKVLHARKQIPLIAIGAAIQLTLE